MKGTIPEVGWAVKTMRQVGVSFALLFDIIQDIFDTKVYMTCHVQIAPWSSNKALLYLVNEIYALVETWLNRIRLPGTPLVERQDLSLMNRNEFSAKLVDEAISKYLVTIPSDSKELQRNLHQLQSRVRRLIQVYYFAKT